jgi:hypothetical protein
MGLPIVIGARSSSSIEIERAAPVEFLDDAQTREPVARDDSHAPEIAFAFSSDNKLQAMIQVTYYDMLEIESNSLDYIVADVSVQIAPLAQSFSRQYRHTRHHVMLPQSLVKRSRRLSPLHLEACFSADKKYLSCLIPYPDVSDSVVVVFSLRKPRLDKQATPQPSLPSYVQNTETSSIELDNAPLASNATILPFDDWGVKISTLCDMNLEENKVDADSPSFLVAGCHNGSILAVSYRPLEVIDMIYKPTCSTVSWLQGLHFCQDFGDGKIRRKLAAIDSNNFGHVYMLDFVLAAQHSPTNSDKSGRENGNSNGESHNSINGPATQTLCVCTRWYNLQVRHGWIIAGPLESMRLISGTKVATVTWKGQSSLVEVWSLQSIGHLHAVSIIELTHDRLQEYAHYKFSINPHHQPVEHTKFASYIQYDATSDCLAVSSYMCDPSARRIPYVCILNWRHHVDGLTAIAVGAEATAEHLALSRLVFACSTTNLRQLVHLVVEGTHCRKDAFDIGTLSPAPQLSCNGAALRSSSSLLLYSTSVCIPSVQRVGCNRSYSVEWQDVSIPASYIKSRGSPTLAVMSPHNCRSVAVAGSHGFCILDCASRVLDSSMLTDSDCERFTWSRRRWHLFSNETDEGTFRVLSAIWWEGEVNHTSALSNAMVEDFLIAIIERQENGRSVKYLSCWSSRALGLEYQLLIARDRYPSHMSWGIRLPAKLSDRVALDILSQAVVSGSISTVSMTRKAVVVVWCESAATNFDVYQLQVMEGYHDVTQSHTEALHYRVLYNHAISNVVGSHCSVFLAQAGFAFDLIYGGSNGNKNEAEDVDEHIVTLGAIRLSTGGVDALAYNKDGIVAFGPIIETDEVSSYWMADAVYSFDRGGKKTGVCCYVYIFQLFDGRLLSWSVPVTTAVPVIGNSRSSITPKQTNRNGVQRNSWIIDSFGSPVHNRTAILGIVSYVGNASTWMQASTKDLKSELILSSVPMSDFGCVIAAGQSCHSGVIHSQEHSHSDTSMAASPGIFTLNSMALFPPVYTAAQSSLFMNSITANLDYSLDERTIEQHLICKSKLSGYQDSTITALQILALRWTEKVAKAGKTPQSSPLDNGDNPQLVLNNIVHVVRAILSPYQFTLFFLELGRQIEPSCFAYLIPLPPGPGQNSGETLMDLFEAALTHGSLVSSVAALPLFSDYAYTQSLCLSIFEYCMNELTKEMSSTQPLAFRKLANERRLVGDVFKYGLRLISQSRESDFDLRRVQSEDLEISVNDDSSEDSLEYRQQYSLACGIFRIFGKKSNTNMAEKASIASHDEDNNININVNVRTLDESTALVKSNHLGNDSGRPSNRFMNANSVAAVAAHFLLAVIFPKSATTSRYQRWNECCYMARLLVGESVAGLTLFSATRFTLFLEGFRPVDIKRVLQGHVQYSDDEDGYLAALLIECGATVLENQASVVLDLILVILAQIQGPTCDDDFLKLLLIAMSVGHVSNRTGELRNTEKASVCWDLFDKSCCYC